MRDIEPIPQWAWHNPDHANRVPYGSVPIGSEAPEAAADPSSIEYYMPGAERAVTWREVDEPEVQPRRRGRPKKMEMTDVEG